MTFALKIAFLDFVATGGIVSVSQTHPDFFLGGGGSKVKDSAL